MLSWVSGPRGAQEAEAEAEPRLALRDLLHEHGLDLAEACTVLQAKAPALGAAGAELLRAWHFIEVRVRPAAQGWLGGTAGERPPAEPDAIGDAAAAACAVRYFWAVAALAPQASEAILALQRCRSAALIFERTTGGATVRASIGDAITAERSASRLEELSAPSQAVLGASQAGAAGVDRVDIPAEDLMGLARQVLSAMWLPMPSEPISASDALFLNNFVRVCRKFSLQLRTDGRAAPSAEVAPKGRLILDALARVLSQFAVGVCKLQGGCNAVREENAALLISVLHGIADLVDALERHAEAVSALPSGPAPVFLGVRPVEGAGGRGASACAMTALLAPSCEQIVLACLLLMGEASGASASRWLAVAHAALCLAAKVAGALLLGAGAKPEAPVRGGVLLALAGPTSDTDAEGAPPATGSLSPRRLSLLLCDFLTAVHDVGLLLPERFRQRQWQGDADGRAATWAKHLFGELRLEEFGSRLCPSQEAPLLMPQLLLSCALRIDCETLDKWRQLAACFDEADQVVVKRRLVLKTAADEAAALGAGTGDGHDAASQTSAWWRRSMRALRGADGVPPAAMLPRCPEVDAAVCRLLARALSCLCALRGVDPEPPRLLADRGAAVCRLLSDPAAYAAAADRASSPDICAHLQQAARPFASCPARHSPAPHVLMLVLVTHQRLLRHQKAGSGFNPTARVILA